MAIFPLQATKFRVVGLLGHSNGEGWGATNHLATLYGGIYQPKGDWQAAPRDAYWKNIYIFTSEQPFPEPSAAPGDTNRTRAGNIANGEWLEMTIANPINPGDPHPHSSPYDYPNNAGACAPRYLYTAWSEAPTFDSGAFSSPLSSPTGAYFTDSPRTTAMGVRHGVEIPLMKLYQTYVGEQVGLVKVAISSTTVLPAESGFSASQWLDPFSIGQTCSPSNPAYLPCATNAVDRPYYAYWTPGEKADWSPASERLYQDWVNKMNGAKAQLPAGVEMDLEAVVTWFGDNDSNTIGADQLQAFWPRHVRMIVNRIRTDAVKFGWTKRPAEQIKIIWPEVHPAYNGQGSPGFNNPNYCNSVLRSIAADDEFMSVLPVSGWKTLADDATELGLTVPILIAAGSHYGSRGYEQAARDIMAAIQEMDEQPFDALWTEEAIDVETAMARVREYYGRGRSNIDMDDLELIQHLNAAMFHCINRAGDNVWWLRRREQFNIGSGPTTVTTLPRRVSRIQRIEGRQDPQYPVQYELIGHGDGGKLQIQMNEQPGGDFWLQYFTVPRRLSANAQMIPAPERVTEWIIVEACRRLAAANSNESLASYFSGESRMLQEDAMRSMGQAQRGRKTRMRTQRRRPNLNYHRGWNGTSWGADG